jgi:hypothetical protein
MRDAKKSYFYVALSADNMLRGSLNNLSTEELYRNLAALLHPLSDVTWLMVDIFMNIFLYSHNR